MSLGKCTLELYLAQYCGLTNPAMLRWSLAMSSAFVFRLTAKMIAANTTTPPTPPMTKNMLVPPADLSASLSADTGLMVSITSVVVVVVDAVEVVTVDIVEVVCVVDDPVEVDDVCDVAVSVDAVAVVVVTVLDVSVCVVPDEVVVVVEKQENVLLSPPQEPIRIEFSSQVAKALAEQSLQMYPFPLLSHVPVRQKPISHVEFGAPMHERQFNSAAPLPQTPAL